MLKLKVIDCKNYIYISRDEKYYSDLDNYLFDNAIPEKTNKSGWYKLDKIPKKVLKKLPNIRENERYELKNGYVSTDMMPAIITKEMYTTDEYEDIIGLYTYKYDEKDGGYGDVQFEISEIYERENFTFVTKEYNFETDLMTQIEYPEEAYQDKPCKISSKEMLKLIRDRVKREIDTKNAKITSDYNFHFEVKKKIGLADSYSYVVNTNANNKRRKPNWVEKMITEKEVTIINFKDAYSSSDYGEDCKVAPSIIGESYEDLCNKIEKYLSDLMAEINKSYCECPNCKGFGVVEVKNEG